MFPKSEELESWHEMNRAEIKKKGNCTEKKGKCSLNTGAQRAVFILHQMRERQGAAKEPFVNPVQDCNGQDRAQTTMADTHNQV